METINTGTGANTFTGEGLRPAMEKVNSNFLEVIERMVELIAPTAAAPTPTIPSGEYKVYTFDTAGSCAWISAGATPVEKGDQVKALFTSPSTWLYTYENVTTKKLDKDKVYNALDKDVTGFVLDAKQGKVLSDAIALKANKAVKVIAGKGTTGGGDLTADRTIDVVALDDSLTVEDDGLKANTVDALDSVSTTRPLSAKQGKELNDKKEAVANKSVDMDADNGSDIKYPTVKAVGTGLGKKVDKTSIYNSLDQTVEGTVLDARQGKVLSDAVATKANKSTRVVAGAGLTGGGDLTTDITFNIVATDDTMVVEDNGVRTNTVDALDSTSSTRPLSAKQGKVLNEAKESLSNKSTDIAQDALSNDKYPTVKTVKDYVDAVASGLLDNRAGYDASTNLFPSTGGSGLDGAILKNDLWYITVEGLLNGKKVLVGSSLFAKMDNPGQTDANWERMGSSLTYVAEDQANKSTNVEQDVDSDVKYPTVKAVNTGLDKKVDKTSIYNGLDKTVEGSVLDARQGKVLSDAVALRATLNSPTFTGNVVVPTADADNEAVTKLQMDTADALKLDKTSVYNGVDKTVAGFALDARQGKVLSDAQTTEVTARKKGYLYLGIATTSTVPAVYGVNDRVYYTINLSVGSTTLSNFGLSSIVLAETTNYQIRWTGAVWSAISTTDLFKATIYDFENVSAEALNTIFGRIKALEEFIANITIDTAQMDTVNIVKALNIFGATNMIVTGTSAPSAAPDFIGQQYINTTGLTTYVAVGVAQVSDWKQTNNS